MAEQWRDCIGFIGFYEVSNLGNVRRKGRIRNLAKVIDKDDYIVHCFCVNNKRTNVMAHKLVTDAFIGPCPIGNVTRHWDGNNQHNALSNLLYGTNKENSEDMVRHGTQRKGEQSHLAKLTEQAVLAIRASKLTQKETARQFGVQQATVSNIINHRTWKHI